MKRRFNLLSPNLQGAFWLLGSSLVFSMMNGTIKHLGPAIPTPETVLFRTVFGLLTLAPFMLANPKLAFAITRPWLHVLRAALGVAAMSANFWTVAVMPLATATALFFTKPLFMPFLAALFLGEGLSRGRVGATILGFLGVLVMLDPDSGVGAVPVAVGLAGALCVALVMIVIKKLTRTEQALAVLVWFTILSSLGVAPIAAPVWVWPQPSQWLALVSLGLTGSIGQYLMIRAYRVGEASAITPVDYTQLIFAGLFGVFLFDELPGLRSWTGMAVIAASTLYITWQERRAAPSRASGDDLL